MSVDIKQLKYKNFGNCISISNGHIEIIVTIDIGPRIISFKLKSKSNIFYNDINRFYSYKGIALDNYYGPGSVFYYYGGHLIEIIPKTWPQTYFPDNSPVVYSVLPNGASFSQPVQEKNKLELSLEILMNENTCDLMIINSIKNLSEEKRILSLSGTTQLCPNGILVIPQNPPSSNNLIPNRSFAFWPYTKMNDERLFIGDKYITVNHNKNVGNKLKIGMNNYSNWASYLVDGCLFTKNYVHNKKARYPDFNSSFELYADKNLLEVSSISPLYDIKPNEIIRHVENWSLCECDKKLLPRNENNIDDLFNNFL